MMWQDYLFNWQTWLIVAFILGALEMMLGSILLGGMALGAAIAALAVALYGAEMAASGLSWAVPLAVWAVGSLLGTAVVNALFGRSKPGKDINELPYKGDND